MIELKTLIGTNDRILIDVCEADYSEFLLYAKRQDCLWNDGSIINPKEDKPDKTQRSIVVKSNLLIQIPYGCYYGMFLEGKPRYLFSKLKEGLVEDERVIEREKRDRESEEYRKEYERKQRLFEEKCRQNRIISHQQLKNDTKR